MPEGQDIKLDFNDRERARHAEALRRIAESATKAADFLLQRDDMRFTVELVMLSLSGSIVTAIGKEVAGALQKQKADEEFPSIIDG